MFNQLSSPRERRPRLSPTAALGICCLLSCLAWAGCAIEKNYKTLSFFFDGVPNPDAKSKAAGGKGADLRKSATYSIHKPFAEDACKECHTDRFQLTTQDSSLCMKCHANRTTEYPKMHGPVAAVACLWCHAPHESAEAHLLKKPARQVCSQCHEQSLLNVERVPAHADVSRSCLDCHSGHGGKVAFFLHDGITPSSPPPDTHAPTPK